MRAVRPAEQDRLPWLEPYKETKAAVKPKAAGGSRKPLIAGIATVLLIAVGGGGYWLGQQKADRQPQASQTVVLAPAKSAPKPVQIAGPPAPAPSTVAEAETPKPVPAVKAKKPARKLAHHRSATRRKIRTAGVERTRIDAVRAQQEAVAKSRRWPKMPSPGPAGQVIQLGAFTTAARANNAYQLRVARYPSLGSMPKVVVPVITKPGGRILYVLRLGTTSRQQSKTVCSNLQRSGDHCLVIG